MCTLTPAFSYAPDFILTILVLIIIHIKGETEGGGDMGFDHEEVRGLLNCIRDGVFITDGEGNIVMLNKASKS